MSDVDAPSDTIQASKWEWAVAALGAVLIGLLWAPWYDDTFATWVTFSPGPLRGAMAHQSISGWSGGTLTSIVIALIALGCIGQALILRSERSPAIGLTFNLAVNFAAIVAVIWIAARIVWPPSDVDPAWGIWASLAVAAAILVVNWLGMTDERDDPALARDVPIRPIPPSATATDR